MALLLRPISSFPLKISSKSPKRFPTNMNNHSSGTGRSSSAGQSDARNGARKLPVLLFDVMDTIVRDPFYEDIPAFFGMSLKELMECKHPTAWSEFEKGLITEGELARKFFKDGRPFDLKGLKLCMERGYFYVDGVERLLHALKQNNYDIHAFTNYPVWYELIEDKLKLSAYLSWTFCSCITGKRKPEPDFYAEVLQHLEVAPASCFIVDDRSVIISNLSDNIVVCYNLYKFSHL
ncbi:hypothetical protein Nepgr_031880 [Nepenthes gracilis]|uniref:Uncharacterized protein n=1 Tax=Nepenthes gracilis TaxID=150966 RepID=A0AAD3TID2_NEPGR|nr:hypothetical protein Nepgr_031880 [Nepenthes gracilis]